MRIPGLRTARLGARWLRSRLARKAVILGYHRIADTPWDPFGLSVSPLHFAEHLEAIRDHGNPISMQDFVEGIEAGDLPQRAIVVTFDDGYVDNLTLARPLLDRQRVPATIFVISGLLGRECWWDELARRFAPSSPLPRSISIEGSENESRCRLPQSGDPQDRLQALHEVHRVLMSRPQEAVNTALEQIRETAPPDSGREPLHRCVNGEELRELASDALIEIGAHTHTHRPLSTLSEGQQRSEITRGKTMLEQLLKKPVQSFSYPHGSRSQSLSGLVRAAGFRCACASHPDVVLRQADLYNLPRLWVSNCNGSAFSRWLRFWIGS
jgi:peptidoglycan/xylan/chitin deacetylase (PgdA/CDA1 family)